MRSTLVSLALLLGCHAAGEPDPPATPAEPASAPDPEPAVAGVDARWVPALRAVAARYASWGRVDDEFRWAPGLCRAPRPASARWSASADAATHGDKLYLLYALDPVAYGAPAGHLANAVVPTGTPEVPAGVKQVLVKEAFAAVPTSPRDANGPPQDGDDWSAPLPAERLGKSWGPGEARGLYVMMQTDDTAGTDQGWVYATIDAGGTITSAGVVESCASCHESAPHGRLFGLPNPPWPRDRAAAGT